MRATASGDTRQYHGFLLRVQYTAILEEPFDVSAALERPRSPGCRRAASVITLVLVAVCAGCPTRSSVRALPADKSCNIKLMAIGRAIAKYRAEKGRLPQTEVGPTGLEHSWRTLVAPYVREQMDSRRDIGYRFDESWDSPHNLQRLQSQIPRRYTCPLEPRPAADAFTSYVMLVRSDSANAAAGEHAAVRLPEDAVLIVESAGCGIEYAEPRDIEMGSLFEGESPFGVGKLNSYHPHVVKALRVDGKVIDIPKSIGEEKLRRLLDGSK